MDSRILAILSRLLDNGGNLPAIIGVDIAAGRPTRRRESGGNHWAATLPLSPVALGEGKLCRTMRCGNEQMKQVVR